MCTNQICNIREDHEREQDRAEAMQVVYDKLCKLCFDATGLSLEEFSSVIYKYDLDLCNDDQSKFINQPSPCYYLDLEN